MLYVGQKVLNNHVTIWRMSLTAVESRVTMNYTDGLIWQEMNAGYFVVSSHLSANSAENYGNPISVHAFGQNSIQFATESEGGTIPLCYACR